MNRPLKNANRIGSGGSASYSGASASLPQEKSYSAQKGKSQKSTVTQFGVAPLSRKK